MLIIVAQPLASFMDSSYRPGHGSTKPMIPPSNREQRTRTSTLVTINPVPSLSCELQLSLASFGHRQP